MDDGIEEMGAFFDRRVEGYDEHMRETVYLFELFYGAVADQIDQTRCPIHILDLGCGTGLELSHIFRRAPNTLITGTDLSSGMLRELKRKYARFSQQIRLVRRSFLTASFPAESFDCCVSVMAMHHLIQPAKVRVYERIMRALKPGGRYVEGDYVVPPDREEELLQEYVRRVGSAEPPESGSYHIDLPFSIATQTRLLLEAGFRTVEVIWHEGHAAVVVASAR